MHCIIAEKTIALVIKRGSARVRGYLGEVTSEKSELISVCYCPPFMSAGIFLNLGDALKETCEMSQKAHCKICLFFVWLHVSLLFSIHIYTLCCTRHK